MPQHFYCNIRLDFNGKYCSYALMFTQSPFPSLSVFSIELLNLIHNHSWQFTPIN